MKTGQDRETRITKFSYNTKCYKCWTPVDRLRFAQTNLTLFKCIREELERSIYIYKYISRIFFSLLLENNFEGRFDP